MARAKSGQELIDDLKRGMVALGFRFGKEALEQEFGEWPIDYNPLPANSARLIVEKVESLESRFKDLPAPKAPRKKAKQKPNAEPTP
jgi:hypothetical protein